MTSDIAELIERLKFYAKDPPPLLNTERETLDESEVQLLLVGLAVILKTVDEAAAALQAQQAEIGLQAGILKVWEAMYEDHGKETMGGLMARVKLGDEHKARAEALAAEIEQLKILIMESAPVSWACPEHFEAARAWEKKASAALAQKEPAE